MRFSGFTLLLIFLLAACNRPANVSPELGRYARFFLITDSAGLRRVTVKAPYPGGTPVIYHLTDKAGGKKFTDKIAGNTVPVPVEKYAATSVTYLEMFKKLGVLDGLKGFTGTHFIADEEIRKRVEEGQIAELGNDYFSDTERLMRLHPEVIFVFSTGQDNKQYGFLKQYGIRPVYVAEWMETHPLGRAEWIKFFGAFFQKDRQADSIFRHIETAYNRIKKEAAKHPERKPKVFQGGPYGDKWYVPGGKSWAAQLIKDAGGEYLIRSGETAGQLIAHEQALMLLSEADIWLNPGTWQSLDEIREALPGVEKLKVFREGKIYSAYIKTGSAGKNEFFEKSVLHPDLVLEDLYRVFTGNEGEMTFFEKIK